MNQLFKFFNNIYVQLGIIVILLLIIIWLITDNFSNLPPHIEQLQHQQLIQQGPNGPTGPPAASQQPSSSDRDGMSIGPPNFGRVNQENTPDNTKMVPGNIYRMNTGRDAYQQEQFVSIYDANFGGMLGTNMGL